MAIKALNWAWDVGNIKPSQRLVLVRLADSAAWDSGRYRAWPSVPYLAAKCCLSERQVERVLKELVRLELIARRRWKGRSGTGRRIVGESTYLYTLAVSDDAWVDESADADNLSPRQFVEDDIQSATTPTSATSDPDICDKTTPTSAPRARKRKNQLQESTAEPTTEAGAADAAAAPREPGAGHHDFHWLSFHVHQARREFCADRHHDPWLGKHLAQCQAIMRDWAKGDLEEAKRRLRNLCSWYLAEPDYWAITTGELLAKWDRLHEPPKGRRPRAGPAPSRRAEALAELREGMEGLDDASVADG